jgi:glycerophosphoryl diester phosphodiesterase
VRFNIETKIMPNGIATDEAHRNHTVGPQAFVDALCGAIVKNRMELRAEVQSFDFRTLLLVEEQYPQIPTYYLTGSPASLASPLVPEQLRLSYEAK